MVANESILDDEVEVEVELNLNQPYYVRDVLIVLQYDNDERVEYLLVMIVLDLLIDEIVISEKYVHYDDELEVHNDYQIIIDQIDEVDEVEADDELDDAEQIENDVIDDVVHQDDEVDDDEQVENDAVCDFMTDELDEIELLQHFSEANKLFELDDDDEVDDEQAELLQMFVDDEVDDDDFVRIIIINIIELDEKVEQFELDIKQIEVAE